MPIVVQHTPAGEIRELATRAGAGDRRIREHGMNLDEMRFDLDQQRVQAGIDAQQQQIQQRAQEQADYNAYRQQALQAQQQRAEAERVARQQRYEDDRRADMFKFEATLGQRYQQMQQEVQMARVEAAEREASEQREMQFKAAMQKDEQQATKERDANQAQNRQRELQIKTQQEQAQKSEDRIRAYEQKAAYIQQAKPVFSQYGPMGDAALRSVGTAVMADDVTAGDALKQMQSALQEAHDRFESMNQANDQAMRQMMNPGSQNMPNPYRPQPGDSALADHPEVAQAILAVAQSYHPQMPGERREDYGQRVKRLAEQMARSAGWDTQSR